MRFSTQPAKISRDSYAKCKLHRIQNFWRANWGATLQSTTAGPSTNGLFARSQSPWNAPAGRMLARYHGTGFIPVLAWTKSNPFDRTVLCVGTYPCTGIQSSSWRDAIRTLVREDWSVECSPAPGNPLSVVCHTDLELCPEPFTRLDIDGSIRYDYCVKPCGRGYCCSFGDLWCKDDCGRSFTRFSRRIHVADDYCARKKRVAIVDDP